MLTKIVMIIINGWFYLTLVIALLISILMLVAYTVIKYMEVVEWLKERRR